MEFLSAPAWLIIIINGHGLNSNVKMSDPHWLRQISYFVKTAFQGSQLAPGTEDHDVSGSLAGVQQQDIPANSQGHDFLSPERPAPVHDPLPDTEEQRHQVLEEANALGTSQLARSEK